MLLNSEFVDKYNVFFQIFNRGFQLAASMSALCGFLISFCSLWFLSTTTATTFSLVGSLNKARPLAPRRSLHASPLQSSLGAWSCLPKLVLHPGSIVSLNKPDMQRKQSSLIAMSSVAAAPGLASHRHSGHLSILHHD